MKACPDCGERVYNLGCVNCHEAAYIDEQERLTQMPDGPKDLQPFPSRFDAFGGHGNVRVTGINVPPDSTGAPAMPPPDQAPAAETVEGKGRYCEMCDRWVRQRECPECGADTRPALKPTTRKP